MPRISFSTRTWPSFGSGTGRSVLYSRTSTPPFLAMETPDMVFGMDEEDDIVREGYFRCD